MKILGLKNLDLNLENQENFGFGVKLNCKNAN